MTLEMRIADLVAEIPPVDEDAGDKARARQARLAKPPGSLGALEALGAQLAAVAAECPPPIPSKPAIVVAAGDHGVHAAGVSAWPQTITTAMVPLLCDGRASISALARSVGAQVSVLDVGVAGDLADHPRLRRARVRSGTADLSRGASMTREDAARAVLAGAGMAEELVATGVDLLVTGDIGIANTTAAACLVAAFTGRLADEVTGRGAGADDATLTRKRSVVAGAVARGVDPGDALGVLAAVGGLEHAALAGLILSGAAEGVPVVLDGVNALAAALVAVALAPHTRGYLIAGHRSTEPGASAVLEHLRLDPLLDLGMHLGEGTGAALAVPLVIAAARVLCDVAVLSDLPLPDTSPPDTNLPGLSLRV